MNYRITSERTLEYKKLRNQGLTYKEIANLCGVTRQAVHISLKRLAKRDS